MTQRFLLTNRRQVNARRFNYLFELGLNSVVFRMHSPFTCFLGLLETITHTRNIDHDKFYIFWSNFFGISKDCFEEWYKVAPFETDEYNITNEIWMNVDLFNPRECMSIVKTIVEKHHGEQKWLK